MSDKEAASSAEDLSLPRATVQKIISEILLQLPPDVSLGNDMSFTKNARDMLIKCCMEWLSMLSAESMEVSEKEGKKTITVEHVEVALKDLGFEDYIAGIKDVVGSWKEVQTKRVVRGERMKNLDKSGYSQEQLEAMQAALFGEAKDKMETPGGATA